MSHEADAPSAGSPATMTATAGASQAMADGLRLLARLARKGAAIVADDAAGTFRVSLPGDHRRHRNPDAPDRWAAPAVVALADRMGWIALDTERRAYRLTETGALALRAGLPPPDATVGANPVAFRAPEVPHRPFRRRRRAAASRALLTGNQAEAAERLEGDFARGQMRPRVTSNWARAALGAVIDESVSTVGVHVSDDVAGAQERVRRALEDAGPEFAGILVDVCCLDMTLEEAERRRQWPRRTARVVLGLALERLARHYGTVATGPARGAMRQWRDGAHRPG